MTIVADESVDFGIINGLRQKGFQILSISEGFSGISDHEVLQIAVKNKCLLITEDKDFGELTCRFKLEHYGILLIRLTDISRKVRIESATKNIELHFGSLKNNFSVLNKKGLRIKKSHILK